MLPACSASAEEYLDTHSLTAFLAMPRWNGDKQTDEFEEAVQLMTLHSASGLEFPLVFYGRRRRHAPPASKARKNSGCLRRKRAACAMSATRAMQKLYLTHAESQSFIWQRELQPLALFKSDHCLEDPPAPR